jgi:4-oxalocrotonate tautomerase
MMRNRPYVENSMPLIHITLAGRSATPATVHHLQQQTTQLMANILRKEAALTVVCVTQLPADACSANGQTVPSAASLQAMITAGTNNPAEKAAFIRAANQLLHDAIGSSVAPIYVALHELPADSWGYDGETQAARKAKINLGEST